MSERSNGGDGRRSAAEKWGSWVKAVWTGPKLALDVGAMALSEAFEEDAPPLSLIKEDDAADEAASWRLEAYFPEGTDLAGVDARITAFDPAWTAIGPARAEPVPARDWVAHALSGLGVVEAGRFLVYGAHDADKLPTREGAIAIRIDANQAFGTGHHPTTAGCLELLSRFAGLPPASVFDLGCGAATLAIAAAKLWEGPVLASDIDETSIEIARENAALNDVADLVEAHVADGFDHPEIAARAPFDFVFANILAGPLVDFAPAMGRLVESKGRAMLAGLMADQADDVLAAYDAAGFRLLNRLEHATWPVLLLVRR